MPQTPAPKAPAAKAVVAKGARPVVTNAKVKRTSISIPEDEAQAFEVLLAELRADVYPGVCASHVWLAGIRALRAMPKAERAEVLRG